MLEKKNRTPLILAVIPTIAPLVILILLRSPIPVCLSRSEAIDPCIRVKAPKALIIWKTDGRLTSSWTAKR